MIKKKNKKKHKNNINKNRKYLRKKKDYKKLIINF